MALKEVETMINIIQKYKLFMGVSAAVILAGIISMLIFGLNQDIDFVGGTTMHVNIGTQFNNDEISDVVNQQINIKPSSIQKAGEGEKEVIIKTTQINTEQRNKVFEALKQKYGLTQDNLLSTDNVTATVGKELKFQALIATLIASVLMLVYISFRFEFKSGVAAVIALIHDVLVMLAVYAILQVPVNVSFIAAILTIVGYSINDTIIVFDRIRENNKYAKKEQFDDVVNKSIWQTIARSINTSLTTLLTITALYVLGVPSIKDFALPLIVGILSGTYSSIFIASPIWVLWREWDAKRKKIKTA